MRNVFAFVWAGAAALGRAIGMAALGAAILAWIIACPALIFAWAVAVVDGAHPLLWLSVVTHAIPITVAHWISANRRASDGLAPEIVTGAIIFFAITAAVWAALNMEVGVG